MKKALMVALALVMALTLVIGSVSTISAEKPSKVANIAITITKVDINTQTIYYTVQWSDFPDATYEWTPNEYQLEFYKDPYGVFLGSQYFELQSPEARYRAKDNFVNPSEEPSNQFTAGNIVQVGAKLIFHNDEGVFYDTETYWSASYIVH